MKVAVMTIAYNEEETIGAVIKNWKGLATHYVFLSTNPWHSNDESDKTKQIAEDLGAIVVEGEWKGETEQRNWALKYLQDYDYVLIVDADELYTEEDKKKILDSLDGEDCYRAKRTMTYWKTTDYTITPPDRHQPCIAINPKTMDFREVRIPNTGWQPVIDVTMHHLSYCKSDEKIKNKVQQFEHYDIIKPNWYEEKWEKWELETEDIHPYNRDNHKAIYKPLPEELKKLI